MTARKGNTREFERAPTFVLGRVVIREISSTSFPLSPTNLLAMYAHALLDADVLDFTTTTNLKLQIQKLIEPWLKSAKKREKLGSSYLIVIDALDEIENDGGPVFLQMLLETINNGHLQGLKFLVTSRPHPQLVKSGYSLPQDAVFHLEEVRRNEAERDIEIFLRDNLPALKDDSRIGAIAQRANGLFIFAATAVRYISSPPG
jgi:hypothetical protein